MRLTRGEAAWALTEAANEPYFNLIIRYVFAPYFATTLAAGAVEGASLWAYAVGATGLVIALTAPVLGSVADSGARLKPWLAAVGLLTAVATLSLWFAVPGVPLLPVALAVMVGGITAEYMNMFSNALLPVCARQDRLGLLSGIAFALAQMAGLLVLLLVLALARADLTTPHVADRLAGPIAALAVILCLGPYLLLGPDRPGRGRPSLARGVSELRATLAEAWTSRDIRLFLLGRMVAADGMAIVFAFGAVLAGVTFGWSAATLAVFGLVITVFGVLGGFLGGFLDRRLGARRLTLSGIALILVGTASVILTDEQRLFGVPTGASLGKPLASPQEWGFLGAGALIAVGAAFAVAGMRTMMAALAPPGKVAAYFGLYSFVGKATAFVGPFLVGLITSATGSLRPGIAIALAFLLAGYLLFWRLRSPKSVLAGVHERGKEPAGGE
ncbi:MFS transporter [Thermaurantiacus sp.]